MQSCVPFFFFFFCPPDRPTFKRGRAMGNETFYGDGLMKFVHDVFLISLCTGMEGDMGVYGTEVLSFFSSGISEILILMCGIAVSFSRAVCGFSSFWLTVFGKRRSFTVLRYCSFGLSCLM